MLLIAIAVVFIGLGWQSAANSDSDPEDGLEAAQSRQSTSAAAPESAAPASSVAASTSASPTTSSSIDPSKPQVCVFNAGTVSGLGQTFTKKVDVLGWETAEPGNLQSASITENTIFYTPRQKAAAEQLAEDLGGDVSVDPRPSAFSQCQGGLALIVVTN
ncbi:LytR C-terminal domain-containing protein [Nocardia sp. 348MFTsu5.1]|uniref:LytR C-terminal domain-containing protein n=1 Tax=Nocardia sp. 348MFTsu5.1 TaxID=1172185 RepID=UPI0003637758|nr:LytR C-terminal domain-containing protein [Nocardia sp. 348MFTsu5.1]